MFESKSDAKAFMRQEPQLGLKRVYRCSISETYHATTKVENGNSVTTTRRRFDIKTVERELKEEAMALLDQVLAKEITQFMEGLYLKDKTYKVSSKMVYEALKSKGYQKLHVMSKISELKRAKVITGLDESVPDQKGALYFALTSVLDEVTTPKKEEVPVDMSKVSVPAQPEKKPIPANPFEDVKKQLSEINQRLTGLAQGYADLANKPTPTVDFTDILRSLDNKPNSTVIAKYLGNIEEEILAKFNQLDQRLTQQRATVDEISLADALAVELTDSANRNSFISQLMSGLPSSSDSEDYKRGLADGIKLAIQMGLKLNED